MFYFRLIIFSPVSFSHKFAILNQSALYLWCDTFPLLPLAGQITQWNLIFYGTNDPPQRNDPPRLSNKKTVNDLVHNSVESSQWNFMSKDVRKILYAILKEREVDDAHNLHTIISFIFHLSDFHCFL